MERKDSVSDEQIVELYWQRSETAIGKTAEKYGNYCTAIARQILGNRTDAEESVNDTWLHAWNSMPPHRPDILSAFLGKITRRISIDRWRYQSAEKRGGGELALALEELEDCVSQDSCVESEMDRLEMERIMKDFLGSLSTWERRVFLRRYWYMDSIAVIGKTFGFSESKVASMLYRTRKKLRQKLESEGYL